MSRNFRIGFRQLVPLIQKSPPALTYEMTTRRRSDRTICRIKHNVENTEHEDPIEAAENINGDKEEVNETSAHSDNVGPKKLNNPAVIRSNT
eukprot:TRINITY_DN25620_c0_g1_i1.p1 TRINITY_DN25620_c0_g1~~TRINITY_DN25620_c0_g1_i1.p1  ORF type:complete len:104 (-),score=33.38 TRINITY_DN25620_c0_g1_i1:108-383(-)